MIDEHGRRLLALRGSNAFAIMMLFVCATRSGFAPAWPVVAGESWVLIGCALVVAIALGG